MKASAVVFPEPNKVEFREVTCPDPGPQHVVVRLTHSWISVGTEGSFLRGERITGDTPYYEGGPWPFPIVPGYQGVGVVEAVGEKITDLSPGVGAAFTTPSKLNIFSNTGVYFLSASKYQPCSQTPDVRLRKLPSL